MTPMLCEVPIGRVEEELVALAGQLSAGLCRWLLLLGEFDRRAQALLELVADGAAATAPSRERPLVHIVVPLADLEAAKGGTIDGRPIAAATVRRMLCDGSVVGVVVDESGTPVAVGTKTRVPSRKVQRAVDVRDAKRCTYPGCCRPAEETHHVLHWVDGHRTDVEVLTSLCGHHHRAHHRGRFDIDIDPAAHQVRFTRPDGTPILTPATTTGTHLDIPARFPTEPGTVPSRWDGTPLLARELTPPPKERAGPTGLRFGAAHTPDKVAARLSRTLSCQFEQEGDVWITSTPDLITITPEPAGGSLITIDLTTRPHHHPHRHRPHTPPPPPRRRLGHQGASAEAQPHASEPLTHFSHGDRFG